MGNALTQGVGVVTGLQERFDWRGVAASAVRAGVGQAVGSALGGVKFGLNDFGNQLVRGILTGLAAGTTAASMRGGRVSWQQIATHAFGKALSSRAQPSQLCRFFLRLQGYLSCLPTV